MQDTFRRVFLPYCLLRQDDGRYAVVNRRYKPVGMTVPAATWVKYEEHPCLVQLTGLTPALAAQLSVDGEAALDRIYLYNDATQPEKSAANWAAYAERLRLLAAFKLKT